MSQPSRDWGGLTAVTFVGVGLGLLLTLTSPVGGTLVILFTVCGVVTLISVSR